MFHLHWLKLIFSIVLLSQACHAHMRMSYPPPIRSPEEGVDVDFDETSPLGVFPCKGFANLTGHNSVATFAAGATIPVKYASHLTHLTLVLPVEHNMTVDPANFLSPTIKGRHLKWSIPSLVGVP